MMKKWGSHLQQWYDLSLGPESGGVTKEFHPSHEEQQRSGVLEGIPWSGQAVNWKWRTSRFSEE